jgi:hypothetical protein
MEGKSWGVEKPSDVQVFMILTLSSGIAVEIWKPEI